MLEHGRVPDAEPLIAEARQIFTPLGATPWLERVDALGVGAPTSVAG